MDLNQLSKWATSFKYKKNNAYIMGLCLTYRVNLRLFLRQTVQALKEIHGIEISHIMVNNYAKTAAVLIRPFVDSYDYKPSNELAADETYIKISGVKAYVWLIMDKVSRSILGYQVSASRDVGPCILTMRMAFDKFKEFPGKALRFIADGYTVLTRLPPSSSRLRRTGRYSLPRSSALPMMMKFPKSSVRLNSSLST